MKTGRPDTKPLFSDEDLSGFLRKRSDEAKAAIDAIPSDEVATVPVDELVERIQSRYSLAPPELQTDQAEVIPEEVRVDVQRDMRFGGFGKGRPVLAEGYRITIVMPFTGDALLFRYRPSTFSSTIPYAKVVGNELHIVAQGTYADRDSDKLQKGLSRTRGEITQYLGYVTGQVDSFNGSLSAMVRQTVEKRRSAIQANEELAASLGLPVHRRAGAPPTYRVPAARKKLRPTKKPPATPMGHPTPELPLDTYDEILGMIQQMAEVMERSPSAFRSMDEEAIRTLFLVHLNAQYEGNATAEAFTYHGRSDIFIRAEDRSVFIAECKFWKGAKKFQDAINQLLNQATWRDGKIALLLFNRNKNFTSVLGNARDALDSHPKRTGDVITKGKTHFRCSMHHVDDPNRHLLVSVLAFDVPR